MGRKILDVAIIDYNISNMFSVQSACNHVGLVSEITNDRDKILSARSAILPGVGAFKRAMNHLYDLILIPVINEFISSGKPFMGICLGFQLLFTRSMEFGIKNGLNNIPGVVKKFPTQNRDEEKIKVPHIGWNQLEINSTAIDGNWSVSPFDDIKNNEYMYFVHSFYVETNKNEFVLSYTNYQGLKFCSSVYYKNIFACQFHPEKSAREGLKIYRNLYNTIK